MGIAGSITFEGPFGAKGERVLYVHGYGGSIKDAGLMELIEGMSEEGYSITCALLPLTFSDLGPEVTIPLREYIETRGVLHIVGFSLGCLVAANLEVGGGRVLISPFWGIGKLIEPMGLKGALAIATGSAKAVIDRKGAKASIGWEWIGPDHPSDPDLERTASAVGKALLERPPPAPEDVIIASSSDHIISLDALTASKVKVHFLRGGHMVLSGNDRKKLLSLVLAALRERPDK